MGPLNPILDPGRSCGHRRDLHLPQDDGKGSGRSLTFALAYGLPEMAGF
jgi:hypothetical protein